MIRRLPFAAAIFLLLPANAESKSGIIQVTGLRTWSHEASTRVIVQTSGPAEFHADRAENPPRLFFDISHSRPWIDQHRIASRSVNDHLVKRVRVAETQPGTTRVVFDLENAGVEFKVTRLDTPDRLVIELSLAGGKARTAPAMQVPVSSAPPRQYPPQYTDRKEFIPPVLPQAPLASISFPAASSQPLKASSAPTFDATITAQFFSGAIQTTT